MAPLWPSEDPLDKRKVTEHTLVWDNHRGILILKRCVGGCNRVFTIPWALKTVGKNLRCKCCVTAAQKKED